MGVKSHPTKKKYLTEGDRKRIQLVNLVSPGFIWLRVGERGELL
jgi:hypothetical protein